MLKGTVTVIVLLSKSLIECENHTLLQTKMARIDTLSMTKMAKKKNKIPFVAAHTCIFLIGKYPT